MTGCLVTIAVVGTDCYRKGKRGGALQVEDSNKKACQQDDGESGWQACSMAIYLNY